MSIRVDLATVPSLVGSPPNATKASTESPITYSIHLSRFHCHSSSLFLSNGLARGPVLQCSGSLRSFRRKTY
jgi:hypothetical protein